MSSYSLKRCRRLLGGLLRRELIVCLDQNQRLIFSPWLITLKAKIIKFIDAFEEMPVAYRIANLVCSCSIEPEAFGRVSVESQSMEIPIIASDIGGSKETIVRDKTGFLFKSGNPNDLAEKIIMVMQKDYNSLKSVGFEGRKNVLKKFDVDKMCRTTFTEYKKLIELS